MNDTARNGMGEFCPGFKVQATKNPARAGFRYSIRTSRRFTSPAGTSHLATYITGEPHEHSA
jgi:hypothetical protein